MLEQAGRDEEAAAFYQRAAEAGSSGALKEAFRMLTKAGRAEEAVRLRPYGIEPGGRIANPWDARVQPEVSSGNEVGPEAQT